MGVVDTLLRRKKVVKTVVIEEEFEEDNDAKNELEKQELKSFLSDLDVRVKALELELKNYGSS
jgi:hypothetical protein